MYKSFLALQWLQSAALDKGSSLATQCHVYTPPGLFSNVNKLEVFKERKIKH